ncbi:MAG: AAA family ATPase [Acidobacteriota bacterium]
MALHLPRPSLVLLIGIAGSGKSTFAHKYFRPTEIVSSDACRALVCDDENDQTATKAAFELLHLIVTKRLAAGKLTVVDATNLQARFRAPLLQLARQAGVPAVAIVLNVPESVALSQNLGRTNRVVDLQVIRQQTEDLRKSLAELPTEGFASVHVLSSQNEIEITA